MEKKFLDIVQKADNILITSHVSPDSDSVCSTLLMGTSLKINFPKKQIIMAAEEGLQSLDWLEGYNDLKLEALQKVIEQTKPNLVIIVDAMNFERCTRGNVEPIHEQLKNSKLVIVDHHEPIGVESSDLYLNNKNPAAIQEVYELLFDRLKLKTPAGFGNTTMLGLYSDTQGFIYANNRHRSTFKIVSDLLDSGVSMEFIYNKIHRYTEGQLKVLAELASNLNHLDDCSYTYIDDSFFDKWPTDPDSITQMKRACDIFLNEYIRYVDERLWGFVLRKDLLEPGYYRVSFRAQTGTKNVSNIAKMFAGGGHKSAAGGKVQAINAEEGIKKIHQAVKKLE